MAPSVLPLAAIESGGIGNWLRASTLNATTQCYPSRPGRGVPVPLHAEGGAATPVAELALTLDEGRDLGQLLLPILHCLNRCVPGRGPPRSSGGYGGGRSARAAF
jgi:hypothetical protein